MDIILQKAVAEAGLKNAAIKKRLSGKVQPLYNNIMYLLYTVILPLALAALRNSIMSLSNK